MELEDFSTTLRFARNDKKKILLIMSEKFVFLQSLWKRERCVNRRQYPLL